MNNNDKTICFAPKRTSLMFKVVSDVRYDSRPKRDHRGKGERTNAHNFNLQSQQ